MLSCVRQLQGVQTRTLIPRVTTNLFHIRLCSSRSNNPHYTPLLDLVKIRQDQAKKSILVQVAGPTSATDLASYCQDQYGDVDSLHYFHNTISKNFKHFFVVQFSDAETVKTILRNARHLVSDEASATPVPVYSPFLWLTGGEISKNKNSATHVPVNYVRTDNCEEKVKSMSDISEQMYQLWKMNYMTDTSLRLRFLVCRQIELAISGMFPHAQVLPFGSAINGFGTCLSDQDMVLDLDVDKQISNNSRLMFQAKSAVVGGDRAQVQRYCEELSDLIQSFLPGCQDVKRILNARVPLIKYSHELTGLECDLSMSSSSGLHMSCLLHLWSETDWRVRPLVATVRRWAKSVGLVKEIRPTQFFTNFTLTMLVVCYLQSIHMLPPYNLLSEKATDQDSYQCRDGVQCNFLHNISNQKGLLNKCFNSDISLSELLLEFFQFYANYNFTTNALCPVSGTSIVKTRRWKNSATIDLINPLEKDLNVSYNVSKRAVEIFQEQCKESVSKIELLQSKKDLYSKKDQVAVEKMNGLFWLFENKGKPPNKPKILVPNLFEMDLGGSTNLEERSLDDLSNQNSTGNGDKQTFSKNLDQKKKEHHESTEFSASKPTDKNVHLSKRINLTSLISNNGDNNENNDSSKDDQKEVLRVEKLRAKYLRSKDHSKFSHKL